MSERDRESERNRKREIEPDDLHFPKTGEKVINRFPKLRVIVKMKWEHFILAPTLN